MEMWKNPVLGPEPEEDMFSGLDPRVAEHMRRKQAAEQGMERANTVANLSGVGEAAINAMTNKPAIFENRMQDLGQAPKVSQGPGVKLDTSGLQEQAREKLKAASHEAGDAVKVAFEQRKAQLADQVAKKQAADQNARDERKMAFDEKKLALESKFKERQLAQQGELAKATAGARQDEKDAKREADREALKIEGYGYANNADDAKQLKDASISKSNFDSKLQQLIDLRTDKKGGAILDREAVARGKQLSKDLLLEYKNLQKLGVLSQSDEAIINAIIPSDPLEYNSPVAAMQGQDPILNNMKMFKGDSDKDFQNRLKMRLKGGSPEAPTTGGGLSPEEQAELEQLEKQFGGK
jgi:hypothetical protein